MSQLRWDPVAAPRLDTRDLAMAGDTLNSGFDRFAQILAQRDQRLNAKATEAGQAAMLGAGSPEELAAAKAQLAAGAFGERANGLAITQAYGQREDALQQNAARQQQFDSGAEDLMDKQAFAEHGDAIAQAYHFANNGDERGYNQVMQSLSGSATGQRIVANLSKDAEGFFGKARDYQAGRADTAFDQGIKTQTLQLARKKLQSEMVAKTAAKKTAGLGRDYSLAHRDIPIDAAKGLTAEDMATKGYSDDQIKNTLTDMETIHPSLNADTADSIRRTAPARQSAALQASIVESNAADARGKLATDGNAMVLKAASLDNGGKTDTTAAIVEFGKKDSKKFLNGTNLGLGSTETNYKELRSSDDVKGYFGGRMPTDGEMVAAAGNATATAGVGMPDLGRSDGFYARTKHQLKLLGEATRFMGGAKGIKEEEASIDLKAKNAAASGKAYVAHENSLARANANYVSEVPLGMPGNDRQQAAQQDAKNIADGGLAATAAQQAAEKTFPGLPGSPANDYAKHQKLMADRAAAGIKTPVAPEQAPPAPTEPVPPHVAAAQRILDRAAAGKPTVTTAPKDAPPIGAFAPPPAGAKVTESTVTINPADGTTAAHAGPVDIPTNIDYPPARVVEQGKGVKAGDPGVTRSVATYVVNGSAGRVTDGDTVNFPVEKSAEPLVCRITSIDAPETAHPKYSKPGQAYGKESTDFLKQLIANKEVTISVTEAPDTSNGNYGRSVCQIQVEGKDVSEEMLRSGSAWLYNAYGGDATQKAKLSLLQQSARQNRQGLWAAPNPQSPGTFKRTH